MAGHHHLGAKLGPRIARVVSDAAADHLHKSASTRASIGTQAALKFFQTIEAERDVHTKPLWEMFIGHPDTAPEVERVLNFLHHGSGELSGLLGMRALGGAAASGIGSGISDLLAPVNQRIMETRPWLALDAGTAAQAAAAGVWSPDLARQEAARNGINPERFDVMRQLAIAYPDLGSAIELWRRGLADESEVIAWLERQGHTRAGAQLLAGLKRTPLAPADAALMALKGIIGEDEGRKIAGEAGYSPGDFDKLVLATGEPPGPESLMMAMRRGFIDQARFAHGIRQSRIRNEWIDVMDKLRFSPASTADAINATIRGYIPESQSRTIAEQNGLEPAHFDFLLKGAGRPPGHMEMIQLQRRGLVTQAQVDQAVRESDIKDKYVRTVGGLYHHLPPERLIVTMVEHGALDLKRGLHLLEEIGFAPDIAQAVVKTGAAQRTAGHKQIALGQVSELYEDHAIDRAKAETMVKGLGYPAEDVPLILQIADLKRHRKWRDQAIAAIRGGFVKHHLTEQQAQAELASVGVPPAEMTLLLQLWELERVAGRRTLTEAQIMHGFRQGHLTADECAQRLVGIGYVAGDAAFLIATAGPIPKGA